MTPRFSKSGFSMIELVAAFAVFAIILLAVGVMVQQSSDNWRTGLNTVGTADDGRAAANGIFRDLTGAVCSRRFPLATTASTMYMITSHWRNDDGVSDLAEVYYTLRPDAANPGRNLLMRHQRNTSETKDGKTRPNLVVRSSGPLLQNPSLVARNVEDFRVRCVDAGGNPILNFNSTATSPIILPARIEVQIIILPEEGWRMKDKGTSGWQALRDNFFITVSPQITPL